VDVRLLVPNGTDIPLLRPLLRAGYRTLLDAGVRIFEWNAKTAVADGHWARVGSTNLNIASWFGNWELDAVIEDDSLAMEMEQAYREDLANATEVVLDEKQKVHAPGQPLHRHPVMTSGGGGGGRAVAGALRIGHAIGATLTDRRVLGPIEARLAAMLGLLLCALAVLFFVFPAVLNYPVVVLCAWGGVALISRGYRLRRTAKREGRDDEGSGVG
jgi:cardiolipin synthase